MGRIAGEGQGRTLRGGDLHSAVQLDGTLQIRESEAGPAAGGRIVDDSVVRVGDVEAARRDVGWEQQRRGVLCHRVDGLAAVGAGRRSEKVDVRCQIRLEGVALLHAILQVEAVPDGVVRDGVDHTRAVCAVQRYTPVVRLVNGAAADIRVLTGVADPVQMQRVPPEHVGLADAPQLDRRHPKHCLAAHCNHVRSVPREKGVSARHGVAAEARRGITARDRSVRRSRVSLCALHDYGAGQVRNLALIVGRRRVPCSERGG
mmetsp:Transcript_27718/g.89564  ORF Transcript_27718/g.89564 Transcript_27718/m.89564 type:complete len:260 (-) Transcript_27718:725-1504(-)